MKAGESKVYEDEKGVNLFSDGLPWTSDNEELRSYIVYSLQSPNLRSIVFLRFRYIYHIIPAVQSSQTAI